MSLLPEVALAAVLWSLVYVASEVLMYRLGVPVFEWVEKLAKFLGVKK